MIRINQLKLQIPHTEEALEKKETEDDYITTIKIEWEE